METFSALLVLCAGNSLATGEFPARKPVTRSFDIFFDLRLVTPYGSANDLLPDGSKPLPETNADFSDDPWHSTEGNCVIELCIWNFTKQQFIP